HLKAHGTSQNFWTPSQGLSCSGKPDLDSVMQAADQGSPGKAGEATAAPGSAAGMCVACALPGQEPPACLGPTGLAQATSLASHVLPSQ
ncbi:hypothetical protein P7K49_001996, partial [Saguinus oedipus]